MLIFVFGSNTAGRHGAGSAKEARLHWGAIYGQGEGRQGSSYAIPTKDANLRRLSLPLILAAITRFLEYATRHPDDTFSVVKIGCGLAGFNEAEIAPLFHEAPANVLLPWGWR